MLPENETKAERLAEIEAAIVAACEKKLAEGWRIERHTTRTLDKRCCALGAIDVPSCVLFAGDVGYAERAAILGMVRAEALNFVLGFDGVRCLNPGPFYLMGARVAARFGL